MVVQTWGQVFVQTLQGLWYWIASFIPSFLFAIIVFIIGWIIASMIGKAIAHVIGLTKVDNLLRQTGLEDLIQKAGFKMNAGTFIGGLVKWFLIIAFLATSLEVLGLEQVNMFLTQTVLAYLPNVIVAALFILGGAVLGEVAAKAIRASARAADISIANLLGSIAKWAFWIFAILIALNQLGIAPAIVQTIVTGVVFMLALAGGLAFGLGGKEKAGEVLDKVSSMIKKD